MFDIKKLRDLDKDDLLHLIGLETRRTAGDRILPAVGIFGVGMLVGAGLGLLLAPRSGRELRDDLRNRIQGAEEELNDTQLSNAQDRGQSSSSAQRPF